MFKKEMNLKQDSVLYGENVEFTLFNFENVEELYKVAYKAGSVNDYMWLDLNEGPEDDDGVSGSFDTNVLTSGQWIVEAYGYGQGLLANAELEIENHRYTVSFNEKLTKLRGEADPTADFAEYARVCKGTHKGGTQSFL